MMTRRIAFLLMLVVLASTIGFLYFMSGQDPDGASSGLNLIGGAVNTYDEIESLPLDGISALDISGVSAHIVVTYEEISQIEAHFHGTAKLLAGSQAPELSTLVDGDTAKISVEPRGGFSYRIIESSLVLEVKVPSSFEGDLSVTGVSGGIAIGDFKAASFNANDVSGGITLGKALVHGTFKANTVSARIEAEEIEAEVITLNSVSGRVTPGRVWGSASVKINSISGRVELDVPSDKGFRLKANSVSGNISCELPVSIETSNSRNLVGTVGDGASLLDITTVSGSINIGSY